MAESKRNLQNKINWVCANIRILLPKFRGNIIIEEPLLNALKKYGEEPPKPKEKEAENEQPR